MNQLHGPNVAEAALAEQLAAIYKGHLQFDTVTAPSAVGARERFEAFARSVRDLLSERWLRTDQTYAQRDPKRVYYLSMEFLIGRQLANNVTNLLLQGPAKDMLRDIDVDWIKLIEEEPDAGLGNGGLGRLAACFLDSLATLQIPAMGYGLRYEYGMFRQQIVGGRQQELPDNWLRRPDPWEVVRPNEAVRVGLGCSFAVRGGRFELIPHRPSQLVGIPFDRPVVGFGGETVGTLRLWGAAAPWSLRLLRRLPPKHSPAFSIPTIRPSWGGSFDSCRSIFWLPAHWQTWYAASAARCLIGGNCRKKHLSS
jgi:glycogen phosphorylase